MLYPLLRRLETQGLLTSEWREEEKRNKRFYRLSHEGEAMLAGLVKEWNELNDSVERILTPAPRSGAQAANETAEKNGKGR